jgi:hypothetical protein
MARSIFTITAPSDSMRLDSRNHGEVVLTVTNTSGRALRGRAKAVPQDPKQAGWIKIGGEAEREFAVSGTQQYTVSVDVPKDGKPGKYSFRFDAVSVELPDEEYTQGPNISFSMQPPVVPTGGPKIPLWLILLLVFVFLVIVSLGIWLIVRSSGSGGGGGQPTATPAAEKVTVPNVGGGTALDDAEKQIRDQGLTPSVEEQASKDFQKGQVIKTDPAAGSEVNPGSTVKLLVAGQTVVIPTNLVGMPCPNAANAVGGLGLIPDLVGDGRGTKLDCSSTALVSAVSPVGGQPVLAGSHVSLSIPGPRQFRIPWNAIRANPRLLEQMHK